ncbi:glycosyltransferase [Cytobacillus firmus]|uniref:glycosyltransferase n=1 Tax=Cytobacillus firmus TaxID=1399 RepID=UPI00384D16F6
MKKTILYIGNFSFPLGNAAGKRVYANGKLLKDLGYDVIFIGLTKESSLLQPLEKTKKEYDGFTYYEYPYPQKTLDWVNYKKIYTSLIKFLVNEKIIDELFSVIYYGSPTLSLFNRKLISYCKKQDIKVLSDCVDWLTTKTNNPLFDMVKWIDTTYQKAYVNKKVDGVISISNYLSNYYKGYGCKTVIIPPLSPVEYIVSKKLNNAEFKKIISYAGIPFRKGKEVTDCNTLKDRIDKIIILLYKAKKEGFNFIFNIYGFTKDEYLQTIPTQKKYIDYLDNNIIFHGIKTNEEVIESIQNSDFTILIRDINRDTTAGFPTKVSESISCGTPVITTQTSDLKDYIIEGKNGFFINQTDEYIMFEDLKRILSIDKKEINIMKQYCLESKKFYYKSFANEMEEFLKTIS